MNGGPAGGAAGPGGPVRVKYPRTPHLPSSPGRSPDDLGLAGLGDLTAGEVVVTEKMDGENTTVGRGYCHARSTSSGPHPSRTRVRALAARLWPDLDDGLRICGENLTARHSVPYDDLPDHLLVFGVWRDDTCLAWDDVLEWCELLDLTPVPVLYRGPWPGEARLRQSWIHARAQGTSEGFVVRRTDAFDRAQFATHVGKWVRAGHVTTGTHWMTRQMVPNGIRRAAGQG